MRAVLVAILLATCVGAVRGMDEPPLPEVAAALDRIADESTVELTTTGRTTGHEHTKPVWFIVLDGRIAVQAGKDGKTDWYRNLEKTPTVVVHAGEYSFRTRAALVTEQARIDDIHDRFKKKYLSARMLSWFGSSIGQGRPVVLTPIAVSTPR